MLVYVCWWWGWGVQSSMQDWEIMNKSKQAIFKGQFEHQNEYPMHPNCSERVLRDIEIGETKGAESFKKLTSASFFYDICFKTLINLG